MLSKQRVCGLPGRQYDVFGFKENQIDYGVSSYKASFDKLSDKRCDLFVEYREMMGGLFLIEPEMGKVMKDTRFAIRPLPNVKASGLVFSASKKSADLIPKLNAGIADMMKKDKIGALLETYFR